MGWLASLLSRHAALFVKAVPHCSHTFSLGRPLTSAVLQRCVLDSDQIRSGALRQLFLRQVVWAKGYTELVDLMGRHAQREGTHPHIDCYGNGEVRPPPPISNCPFDPSISASSSSCVPCRSSAECQTPQPGPCTLLPPVAVKCGVLLSAADTFTVLLQTALFWTSSLMENMVCCPQDLADVAEVSSQKKLDIDLKGGIDHLDPSMHEYKVGHPSVSVCGAHLSARLD